MISHESTTPQAGPLQGVRVVELASMGPSSFTAMQLADLGADVVRIDRPGPPRFKESGVLDDLAAGNDILNRGRRRLQVDLKSQEERAAFHRVVSHADVLIESFRPGVAERLGIGPDVLLATNPRLVYCRLSGYGQSGALKHEVGHDINYLAMSGALHILGREEHPPEPPLNLLADYAGGGLLAVVGVLAALVERGRSGQGQVVDAAMIDGATLVSARILSFQAMRSWDSDRPGTNLMDGGAPFYRCYTTKDGRHMALGALEARFYAEFIARISPDAGAWPAQQDRARWPELGQLIAEAFATKTQQEWVKIFDGTEACVSPVLTFSEAAEHPHNHERSLLVERNGALEQTPLPRFSRTQGSLPASADLEPTLEVDGVIAEWEGS